MLLRSGEAVVWLAGGRERGRLVPARPPEALLEADPADPAVYVAADRLYRWPCRRGAGPVALAVRAEGVVALLRDPRRPGRIWVLGERGLQRLEGSAAASARPGDQAAEGRSELGGHRRGRRRAKGSGLRGRGACGRRALAELTQAGREAWRLPWTVGSAEAERPAPRAAWLPRITLSAAAVVHHAADLVLSEQPRLARRRRPRFQALLSLRWPLEVPAPAVLEAAGARAAARRAALARRIRRLLPPCGTEGDPIARLTARAEREAVERYFRAEAARRRHGKGPGRGAPPGPRTVEEIP